MFVLTAILLLLVGMALGLARRAWWEIGLLTVLVCGALQLAHSWMGNWRDQVGLPNHEGLFEAHVIGWLLVGVYVSYALGFLYSRWRLSAVARSDR